MLCGLFTGKELRRQQKIIAEVTCLGSLISPDNSERTDDKQENSSEDMLLLQHR